MSLVIGVASNLKFSVADLSPAHRLLQSRSPAAKAERCVCVCGGGGGGGGGGGLLYCTWCVRYRARAGLCLTYQVQYSAGCISSPAYREESGELLIYAVCYD